MILEHLESRVLAAIRFLDAETEQPVSVPLTVRGEGLKLVRNRSGLHVITAAPGYEDYTTRLEVPSSSPAPAAFTLTASDPSRRYLARSFTVQLPRTPALPASPEDPLPANSVFVPRDVWLFPSPIARASPGSAVVRVRVEDKNGKALPNALVSLTLDDPEMDRRGVSNENGDALVLVPGLPIANWSNPAVTPQFTLEIRAAWVDTPVAPDPDTLSAGLQSVTGTIEVAAGEDVNKTIRLSWVGT